MILAEQRFDPIVLIMIENWVIDGIDQSTNDQDLSDGHQSLRQVDDHRDQ